MTLLERFLQTPEQKEEDQRKKQLRQEEAKQVYRDANLTFSTDHGRRTLLWIMGLCGYQKPSVVFNPESQEIQTQSTIYNEARRNLYLTIRSGLHRDILTYVEHANQKEDIEDLLS